MEQVVDQPKLWVQSSAAQRLVDTTSFLTLEQPETDAAARIVAVVTSPDEADQVIKVAASGVPIAAAVAIGVKEETILRLVQAGLTVGAGMLSRLQILDLTAGRGAIALSEAEALAEIERAFGTASSAPSSN
jgi:hypothetical protein